MYEARSMPYSLSPLGDGMQQGGRHNDCGTMSNVRVGVTVGVMLPMDEDVLSK
jgi:hypothetical protein